ncbi:MAG TPA: hypothetical protein VGJ51_01980 [Candidatus Angelobacter sp.]
MDTLFAEGLGESRMTRQITYLFVLSLVVVGGYSTAQTSNDPRLQSQTQNPISGSLSLKKAEDAATIQSPTVGFGSAETPSTSSFGGSDHAHG